MNNYDYVNNKSYNNNGRGNNGLGAGSADSPTFAKKNHQLHTLMMELGYASCESSTLKDLYSHLSYNNVSFVLRENDVAKALGMMMSNTVFSKIHNEEGSDRSGTLPNASTMETGSTGSWDVESFVDVINELVSEVNDVLLISVSKNRLECRGKGFGLRRIFCA